MKTKTLQLRVPVSTLRVINQLVADGIYDSVSDFLRSSIVDKLEKVLPENRYNEAKDLIYYTYALKKDK